MSRSEFSRACSDLPTIVGHLDDRRLDEQTLAEVALGHPLAAGDDRAVLARLLDRKSVV